MRAQGFFGSFEYYGDMFVTISPANANAVVAAQRDGVFGSVAGGFIVSGKKRKANADGRSTRRAAARKKTRRGMFDELPADQQETAALVARAQRKSYEEEARVAHREALAAHRARDRESVKKALERQVVMYDKALRAMDNDPINTDADVAGRVTMRTLTARVDGYLAAQQSTRAHHATLKEAGFILRHACPH